MPINRFRFIVPIICAQLVSGVAQAILRWSE